MIELYIDADACPVRREALDVAARHALVVWVVTCGNIRVPPDPRIRLILTESRDGAVDDWIAERIGPGDIAVTADIPLAARCLDRGARALGSTGKPFTPENIGSALAARALAAHLRELGTGGGGPRPLAPADRSRFRSALETMVQAAKRAG
jgi:uncharacterized protein YaiI (UPF0178 family)